MKDTPHDGAIPMPRWYQDLSIPQMQKVFSLGDIIRADYDEQVTGRTRRALCDIGVTSTFVKITPEQIKKSRRLTDLDPVKFLCEIYRIVTGNYFTDEAYKKVYDCNERIILSAIAFLTLPETVIELHHRIPMGETPKLPPKPMPHKIEPRKHAESPFLEPLFTRPDWLTYARELYLWRKRRAKIPFPKAILPPLSQYSRNNKVTSTGENEKNDKGDEEKLESYQQEITDKDEDYSASVPSVATKTQNVQENETINKARGRIHEISTDETGRHSRPNFGYPENKSYDEIGAENKRTRSQVASSQPSRLNIVLSEKKSHDKIDVANKRTRSHAQSRQRSSTNIISQENTNHDEIGAGNERTRSQVGSRQLSRPTVVSQKNKSHYKIGAGNERTRSKVRSHQLSSPNSVSQENKNHDKIGAGNERTRSQVRSRQLSSPNRVSQENKSHHKIGAGNKRTTREAKSHQLSRPNIVSNKSDYWSQHHSRGKSCLGMKDTHLMVSGITENDDLPDYPFSYTTGGIAYVTPENSDESFFAALNLNDGKKEYPRGRENLSRKWQEWLLEMDEEFMKVEKQANEIIKSFDGTLKLMGPQPTCDGCCSCRQTRKSNVKYHRTKTPQMVIDSVTIDGKHNKYVVGSLVMNSPAASPSESTTDLPEVIASHDKIIKNKIIGGVTNEMGETNVYISGVNKEIEHVPRKIISSSKLPKPIKNVPPCGCAIEKFINEGLTEFTSDDNIPWTKKEQSCIGKKYRSGSTGANSCRDFPNDKTCKRNPFKKKIDEQIKAKLRENENSGKDNYPPKERNMYSMADFQPCGDEDGMAVCGGPWGAVNIPDEEELARREAEAKLIRESPPCGDKPGRAICGAPFGSRHPIPKKPKRDDDDEDEEDEEPDEEELEEMRRRKLEGRKKVREKKIEKLYNRDDHCDTVAEKDRVMSESPVGLVSKMQQFRMSRMARKEKKRKTAKENETGSDDDLEGKSESKIKRDLLLNEKISREASASEQKDENWRTEEQEKIMIKHKKKSLKDQWNRSKIMTNKFLVSPVIIPEDRPGACKREVVKNCYNDDERLLDNESIKNEGPFGRRTKSEEALPVEKTLIYLANPDEPVARIPVRPGGRPCKCRENRNAKKTLLYNVAGTIKEGKGKRDQRISHVIDGLIYITPTPSVRNSEEYIPEYELYESPYEKCIRERKNDDFKYIEKYLGPKSLMVKQPRGRIGCKCSSMKEEIIDSSRQEPMNNDELMKDDKNWKSEVPKVMNEVALPEEKKWSRAPDEEGLIAFYARCRDNVPCWLRCVEFSNDGCCVSPRALQVKRPVCECKYERKIVKRDEEKKNWLNRQERLKSHKKQPYSHIGGVYGPMETETALIISDVSKNISKKATSNDHPKYYVAGVTQDLVMRPPEDILAGIEMHTPIVTPEPSKPKIPMPKAHRHWSPVDIGGTSTISGVRKTSQLRESAEMNWRDKIGDKSDKGVNVLFESDPIATNHSRMKKIDSQVNKSLGRDKSRSGGKYDMNRGKSKDDMNRSKSKGDMNRGKSKDYMNRSKSKGDMNRGKSKDYMNRSKSKGDMNRSKSKGDTNRGKSKDYMNRGKSKDDMNRGGGRHDLNWGREKHFVSRDSENDGMNQSRAKNERNRGEGKENMNHDKEEEEEEEGEEEEEAMNLQRRSKEGQKQRVVSPVQDPHEIKAAKSSGKESRKKSGEKYLEESNKNDAHTSKSTGNIVSKENAAVHEQGKKKEGDLKQLLRIELRKMADEGFLFAQLPNCHQMPQLQYWIMYRKGIAFSPEAKQKLMDRSLRIWKSMEKEKSKKIEAPPLDLPKKLLKHLSYDKLDEVKRQVALKRQLFYSNLRKSRVLQARAMWGLMEFGKFPGVSFKRAFFTYQACKESDGFVFRPYQPVKH